MHTLLCQHASECLRSQRSVPWAESATEGSSDVPSKVGAATWGHTGFEI